MNNIIRITFSIISLISATALFLLSETPATTLAGMITILSIYLTIEYFIQNQTSSHSWSGEVRNSPQPSKSPESFTHKKAA